MALKLFVSQPMNGKSKEEIENTRAEALKKFLTDFPDNEYDIIDSIQDITKEEHNPLYWLSVSLKMLSEANMILMLPGWTRARGCVIEYICASQYGITICNQDTDVTAEELVRALAQAIDDTHEGPGVLEVLSLDRKAAYKLIKESCDKLSKSCEEELGSENVYTALGHIFDELIEA